jgi:cellulose synthase (UDP-forming)
VVLAIAGGIWTFAPQQYFPFSAQIHGTFQSFKILPTVLTSLVKPFGHPFKVTPKGANAKAADYDRTIFWMSAGLMMLTILGLVINARTDWRIVGQSGSLGIAACWAVINIVILFFTCMMSLQAPAHRDEERFSFDEPISIFSASGAMSTGRIKDISLSGAAIIADDNLKLTSDPDQHLRLFVTEVGFVTARVIRHNNSFLAVQFDLPPSVERDLLIRKLFTAGLDATTVDASALSSTGAMLMSIWSAATTRHKAETAAAPSLPVEKLPAESLVIVSRQQPQQLARLAAERDIAA